MTLINVLFVFYQIDIQMCGFVNRIYKVIDRDLLLYQLLVKFQWTCGTIHEALPKKTRIQTRVKFFNIISVAVFLYGSETWTPVKDI